MSMKALYKKGIVLIIVLISISFVQVYAKDKVKKMVKSYALSQNTYVEIENKYGDIEIENWDKDSIRLEIVITVHSDKDEDLDKMLNNIKIDLTGNSSFIIAKTDWSEEVNAFKKGILKINQEVSSNGKYSVNYKIKMPKDVDLTLTNKFGNIFMSDYSGKLIINLSYGDLRAHKLSNLKQLSAKYGKVKVTTIPTGRISLSSVKPFNIDHSQELEIESSSSEIIIEEINSLNLKSSHDDITIDKIAVINGTYSMSDLLIISLYKSIHSVSKYGSLKLKEVSPSTDVVFLEGVKTDMQITYNKGFYAKADIRITSKEEFTSDASFIIESTEVDSESLWHAQGYTTKKGNAELTIKSVNGYVSISSYE